MSGGKGDDDGIVRARRAKVDSVDLYEIKDHELDQLESGSPGDVQLNWAVFLLSLAFASITTLFTVEKFVYPKAENIFMLVAVVGVLLGLYLISEWYRMRKSLKSLCGKIRDRMAPVTGEEGTDNR